MQCLTENEISHWLRERGIPEAPYHQVPPTSFYLQFFTPPNQSLSAFFRQYWALVIGGETALVHITDWGLYTASEMIPLMGIRALHSETRTLIDAPGHLLETHESETVISLMTLTTFFAWSSYWYSPSGHSILYNWEGDIFDFWTDDAAKMEMMKRLLVDFDLRETTEAK